MRVFVEAISKIENQIVTKQKSLRPYLPNRNKNLYNRRRIPWWINYNESESQM